MSSTTTGAPGSGSCNETSPKAIGCGCAMRRTSVPMVFLIQENIAELLPGQGESLQLCYPYTHSAIPGVDLVGIAILALFN